MIYAERGQRVSKARIYHSTGTVERNLAAIDLMENITNDTKAVCFHQPEFGEYDGATLYAARTPNGEINHENSEKHNYKVVRRETGGSPIIWRPEDIVLTVGTPDSAENLLEDYIGPVITDELSKAGYDKDFEIKSGANRRSIWIDGKPISSFSSKNKDANLLSGYIAGKPYDAEKISEVITLRPGEKEYIDRLPSIPHHIDNSTLKDDIIDRLSAEESSLDDWNRWLDEREKHYEQGIENRSGSTHRGFCPVYREDLVQFRKHLEQSRLQFQQSLPVSQEASDDWYQQF